MENYFLSIKLENWIELIKFLDKKGMTPLYAMINNSVNQKVIERLMELLMAMHEAGLLPDVVNDQVQKMPNYLEGCITLGNKYQRPATANMLKSLDLLTKKLKLAKDWKDLVLGLISNFDQPKYRNVVIVPVLLNESSNSVFFKQL